MSMLNCLCGYQFRRLHHEQNVCRCGREYDGQGKLKDSPEVRLSSNSKRERSSVSVVIPEDVGDELAAMIPDWATKDKDSSCGCDDWRKKMNRWKIDGCKKNQDLIVDHLVSQTDHLIMPLRMSPKILRRSVAQTLVKKAISATEKKVALIKAVAEGSRYSGTKSQSESAFVMNSTRPIFVGVDDMAKDAVRLASMIPADTTAICGVARSGLTPANIVANMLHLPMLSMRQSLHDIIEVGNGWRIGGDQHVEIGKDAKVVCIDDSCMTGKSLKTAELLLSKHFDSFKTACLYRNPLSSYEPDLYVKKLDHPHLLEWNLFNSVLSSNCATDFDGILCRDCKSWQDDDGEKYLSFIRNAIPLYLSRRSPIPLIVTARIERYREQTEEWLHKHGVRFDRLVMHPAKTLEERNRDDVAAFKAKHFDRWASKHKAKPRPSMFIESDDQQAKRIAELTKRFVLCPATKRVYGTKG